MVYRCIISTREREREDERTNRETRFRFEVAFSISPRLLLLLENVVLGHLYYRSFHLFFRDIYDRSIDKLSNFLKIKFFKFVRFSFFFFSNLARKKYKWSFRNITYPAFFYIKWKVCYVWIIEKWIWYFNFFFLFFK